MKSVLEKIKERLETSLPSLKHSELSEEIIVKYISDLAQLHNYSTIFLQSIIGMFSEPIALIDFR